MCKFDTYTGSALKGVQMPSMRISLEAITVIMPLNDRKCRFQTIKTKQTKWHTPSVRYDMSEGLWISLLSLSIIILYVPGNILINKYSPNVKGSMPVPMVVNIIPMRKAAFFLKKK